MSMRRFNVVLLFVIGLGCAQVQQKEKEAKKTEEPAKTNLTPKSVKLKVTLPTEDSHLSINGKEIEGKGAAIAPRELEVTIGGDDWQKGLQNLPKEFDKAGKLPFTMPTADEILVWGRWEPNSYTTKWRFAKVKADDAKDGVINIDLSQPNPQIPDKIEVVFIPTPKDVVAGMCKLAKIGKEDIVYDLGCGDGRMVLQAVADFNAKLGVGVDLDPKLVAQCKKTAETMGITERMEFRQGDVLDIKDLSRANVVLLYMGEDINLRLKPILQKTLKPGSRVVSHAFGMGDWKPNKTVVVDSEEQGNCTLYLWIIGEEAKEEPKVKDAPKKE